jgi:hypothetical protein
VRVGDASGGRLVQRLGDDRDHLVESGWILGEALADTVGPATTLPVTESTTTPSPR